MILFPKRRYQSDGVGSEADGCSSTASGKVQPVPLPGLDPCNSEAAWFRDYAAYCGVSDDGKKGSAILVQLGRRKPLLKKALGGAGADTQEAKCGTPIWQRAPSRVTFEPKGEQKFTFAVPTRAVELVTEEENAGEE